MQQKQRWRLLALILLLVLAFSFLWCIVDDIIANAAITPIGAVTPVTSVTITGAILWLLGHGIHGAAVIALPDLLLRYSAPGEQSHA